MNNLCQGTFVNTKDDSYVAYLVESGFPKEETEKMKGTHWTLSLEWVDGKVVANMTCKEIPELSSLDTYTEGVEKDVDHPIFGGKGKLLLVRTGDSSLRFTVNSEKYGIFVIEEAYTEDGATFTTTSKSTGKTRSEFWERKIAESGSYRVVKSEGLETFFKAVGLPVVFAEGMKSFIVNYKITETTHVMTEKIPGAPPMVSKSTLDEEFTYAAAPSQPGMPNFLGKMVNSRVGPGKYKMVYVRDRDGGTEIWDTVFHDGGLKMSGMDKGTGQTAFIWMDKFTDITGKFRPVAFAGFQQYGTAVGLTPEMASKMASDYNAVMSFEEKDKKMHFDYDSKLSPMKYSFNWNTEFEHELNMLPGKVFKCLNTLCGDTITAVWKGPSFTTVTTIKFSETFVIHTSKILGTSIMTKIIFERM